MLVLSRKRNESIVIGDDITVTVVGIRSNQIRIGIDAPAEVPVHRHEVALALMAEQDEWNPVLEEREMVGRSLLVVSHDPGTRSVLATALVCEGADVDTADSSACALEFATEKKYDVAIIDEALPRMHGQELFDRLNGSQTGLRGILCSEHPTVATVEAAFDYGMDHVLEKPINQTELVQLAEALL